MHANRDSFKTQLTTCLVSVPIVYIPHPHYNYVDQVLREILDGDAAASRLPSIPGLSSASIYEYDFSRDFRVDFLTKKKHPDSAEDPSHVLRIKNIVSNPDQPNKWKERILLYKNFSSAFEDSTFQLLLQTFSELYENRRLEPTFTIIFVDPQPVSSVPQSLTPYFTVIDVPHPSAEEIKEIVESIPVSAQFSYLKPSLQGDLCRTLQGLHLYEINQILRSSLMKSNGFLTKRMIGFALEEKKQIARKSGIIDVIDTEVSFDQIGGLEILKEDLGRVAAIYKNLSDFASLGLPMPKGILLMGMPGCGKSMIAKAIANEFKVSLLRLDINRLLDKYVGQSEENLRKALSIAEAAHPCVLWIDEIEKAFAGTNTSGGNDADMLVTRMLGHFLTWMQERNSPVYVVATANDVMRPEFMRKGRFDEVYFVDFPNRAEREEIFVKSLKPFIKSAGRVFDFAKIADKNDFINRDGFRGVFEMTEGFSGSEISSVVNETLKSAYVQYSERLKDFEDFQVKPEKYPITPSLFVETATRIARSIMSKQKSSDPNKTTAIEAMKSLSLDYHFQPASREEKKGESVF